MVAFLTGAALGASLIIAIGAQNAFVLGQAIRQNYALTVALVCSAVDAALISLGVWGLGAYIENSPKLLQTITLGGAVFLLVYGCMAFKRALRPTGLASRKQALFTSVGKVIATTLALSLLNPHVYLDTVLLLGSIGGRLPGHQPFYFAAGAVTASFVWFLMLATGGKLLAPVLDSPKNWQRLDVIIGLIMFAIAASLLNSFLSSQIHTACNVFNDLTHSGPTGAEA